MGAIQGHENGAGCGRWGALGSVHLPGPYVYCTGNRSRLRVFSLVLISSSG